jgi:streptogramin lyase
MSMGSERGVKGWKALASVAVLAMAACSTPPSSGPSANCAPASVVVAAGDYSSSEIGLLAMDGGEQFYEGGTSLGSDPALASSRGRLFWISRSGQYSPGEVYELDPHCATSLHSWSANDEDGGGGSNPQDIAVAPDGTLWVARFDRTTILIKSSDGGAALDTIDLANVTGVARKPYMSSIRIIDGADGSKAYVALEMLTPTGSGPNAGLDSIDPSYIARIDVATRKVDGLLQLKGRNPFGLMVEYDDPSGDSLYLAEPGNTQVTTDVNAGIERVDVNSFTSELIVRETEIGASVDQLSIGPGCGTAVVMGPGPVNVTSMISFDPTTGAIITPLSKSFLRTDAGFELAGMAWLDGGLNLVGDRTGTGAGYAVHAVSTSNGCMLSERASKLLIPQAPVAFQPIP